MEEDTLQSPGIWPSKEELAGEGYGVGSKEPGDTHAQPNYESSSKHVQEIKDTLLKEKALGMVLGPFSKAEAAEVCQCSPGGTQ